jgi:hypothetical protein
MVNKRRSGSGLASRNSRNAHTSGAATAPKRARTRTSLIGVTIYQPDVEPSAQGRRLLDALNSTYQSQQSLEI